MSEKNVHTEHCCVQHGCKYGDEDCPVANGRQKQSFSCEDCEMLGGFFPTQFHVEVQAKDGNWRVLTATPFDTITEAEDHINLHKSIAKEWGALALRTASYRAEVYYIIDVKGRSRGEIRLYPYEVEMTREKLRPLILTSEHHKCW